MSEERTKEEKAILLAQSLSEELKKNASFTAFTMVMALMKKSAKDKGTKFDVVGFSRGIWKGLGTAVGKNLAVDEGVKKDFNDNDLMNVVNTEVSIVVQDIAEIVEKQVD